MDGSGTFGMNSDYENWGDTPDDPQYCATEVPNNEYDEETNTEPDYAEILNLFESLFRVIEELHFNMQQASRIVRIPQRTSPLTGHMWMYWVLTNPNRTTCYERFRMYPCTFMKLCSTLKNNGYLGNSRYVKITEKVAAFLLVVCQAHSQRSVADRLQRSTHTISTYVGQVCKALCRLGNTLIQPCAIEMPHPYVARDRRYYPWFKDCIGAIDGTHIMACVTKHNVVPFIGRKKTPTQNVMCVTDFDLCFTFVCSGWEGSAHDSRIFTSTINDPVMRFPTPAEGFYYLVDSGYACSKGFLPPYRNERYHLPNFRDGGAQHRRKEELFNHRHSSLRSVVERTFGIWKNRFKILENMPPYEIPAQRLMVIACCTVHNFIRKDCADIDPLFSSALQEMYDESWINVSQRALMPGVSYVSPGQQPDQSEAGTRFMGMYQNSMCYDMWRAVNGD